MQNILKREAKSCPRPNAHLQGAAVLTIFARFLLDVE
jgi:hypothetical protein